MSHDRRRDPVQALLAMIAEHLEAWSAGDEQALEGLGDALQEAGFDLDDVEAAVLTLRSPTGLLPSGGVAAVDEAPGRRAQRVLSPLERASLSPEAWGFLLALRRRGALDARQFERVLDRLTAIGVRPVDVELAREVAERVALRGAGGVLERGAGDGDPAH